MALTAKVDALLLVSRLGTLTTPKLQELSRNLRRSPASILGFVATGAEVDEGYAVYTVEEYRAEARPKPEATQPTRADVPEVSSASGGSGRWAPRRNT
jgi:hypothetical protein